MSSKRKAKKLKDINVVHADVRRLVDPSTGEVVSCLVPSSEVDRRLMKEFGCRFNDTLRISITHHRNVKFHRLVHQLGTAFRLNVPGFERLNSHAAIKRLQLEAGVCCEIQQIDASPVVGAILAAAESLLGLAAARMLGSVLPEIKTIDVLVPQSIAYDCMDETEFRFFWKALCAHIVARYWPSMTPQQIDAMADLMPLSEGA